VATTLHHISIAYLQDVCVVYLEPAVATAAAAAAAAGRGLDPSLRGCRHQRGRYQEVVQAPALAAERLLRMVGRIKLFELAAMARTRLHGLMEFLRFLAASGRHPSRARHGRALLFVCCLLLRSAARLVLLAAVEAAREVRVGGVVGPLGAEHIHQARAARARPK
jgi:hypothetical protein